MVTIDRDNAVRARNAPPGSRRSALRARWTLAVLTAMLVFAPAAWIAPRTAVHEESVHWVLSAGGRGLVPLTLAPLWMALGRGVWRLAPAAAPHVLVLVSAAAVSLVAAFSALMFLDLPQDRLVWQRTRRLPRSVRYWWPAFAAGVLIGWSPVGAARALAPQPEAFGSALVAIAAWLIARTFRRRREGWQEGPVTARPLVFTPTFLLVIGMILGGAATFGGLISVAAAILVLMILALEPRTLSSPIRLACGALGLALGLSTLAAQAWALCHGANPSLGGPLSYGAAVKGTAAALARSAIPRGTRLGTLFFLVLFAAIPTAVMAARVERRRDPGSGLRSAAILVILPLALVTSALNVFQPVSPLDPARRSFPGAPSDALPLIAWSALALVWLLMAVFAGLLGQPVRDYDSGVPLSASRRRVLGLSLAGVLVFILAGTGWRSRDYVLRYPRLAAQFERFDMALADSVREARSGRRSHVTLVVDGSSLDGRLRLALRALRQDETTCVNVKTIERRGRGGFAASAERKEGVISALALSLSQGDAAGTVVLLHPDLCAALVGACAEPVGLLHRLTMTAQSVDSREWAARQERFAVARFPSVESGGAKVAFPAAALRWSRFANELGVLLVAGGEAERAVPWFREAVALLPANVAGWGNLALIHAGAGDNDSFSSSLKTAKQEAFRLGERLGGELTYVSVHRSMGDVAAPIWFIAAASQAMSKGYAQGAAYMATLGSIRFPESYRLALLAGGLRTLIEKDRAESETAAIRARFPEEPMAEVGIGLLRWIGGDLEAATETLQSAAAAMPDQPATRLLLSRLRESRGDLRGALEEIQTAARMGFESPDAARRESQILLAMGETDSAVKTIRDALEAYPNDARLLVALGQIQISRGEMQAARASLDAAYEADPGLPGLRGQRLLLKADVAPDPQTEREARDLAEDPAEGWAGFIALARIAQARGDVPLAVRYYRDSLAYVESFFALNNLAVLLAAPGQYQDLDEALRLSAKAFDQAPDNVAVVDTRGWILFRAGRVEEAAPLLEHAWESLQRAPGAAIGDRAAVALHLASLRLKQGQTERARELITGVRREDLPPEDRPYLERLRNELPATEDLPSGPTGALRNRMPPAELSLSARLPCRSGPGTC